MAHSRFYTKAQADMFAKVSGIVEEISCVEGGTFKLHRIGTMHQVEYYNKDGSFSHIVSGGTDDWVFGTWLKIKETGK